MSDLTDFRDHCRRMAKSLHRPDCPSQRPAPIEYGDGDATVTITACMGCLSKADKVLWIRLADEIDTYLDDKFAGEGSLW